MSAIDTILIVVLVIVLPAYTLVRSLARPDKAFGGDRVQRYQHTIVRVTLLSLALAAIWVTDRRPAAWLGLSVPDRLGWSLIAMSVVLICALLLAAPRAKQPANAQRNAAVETLMPVGRHETLWFMGCILAVGAGWELLYRGYLLWALAPTLGTVGAVLVMGLSYGIAHGYRSAGALAASIASALLFATAYALSLSLWWLIVIHIGLPLVGLRVRQSSTP